MASTNKSFLSGQRLLLLALVAGVISAVLVGVVLTQATKSDDKGSANTVTVVKAKQQIPAFAPISSDMLQVEKVAPEEREQSALGAIDQAAGRIARETIKPGSQVLSQHLLSERDNSRLAFNVPSSKRAVSVAVSEVIGAGGLIQPGDFVDVIVVLSASASTGAGTGTGSEADARVSSYPVGKARVLLQNVQVLAVAQKVSGIGVDGSANGAMSEASTGGKDSEPDPEAKTVTLAVSITEAQQLVLGEELGELRLAVRPATDDKVQDVPEAMMSWSK